EEQERRRLPAARRGSGRQAGAAVGFVSHVPERVNVDRDAARSFLRREQRAFGIRAEAREHALDQRQVESADELGMAHGDLVERAIAQAYDPRLGLERLVAATAQK